jgi:hypothetical protein
LSVDCWYFDAMRLRPVLLLVLAATVSQAGAFEPPPSAAATKAKANCKPPKVLVAVNGKKSCKPFSKLFPKPKAVDLRLAHLRQTLRFDPAKAVRGKKRQRARTLQSGFGAAGKRAQRKLLKVLPKALAFIDRKGGARSSRSPAGRVLASKGCQPGPAGPQGNTDGATIGALGDNGGFVEAPAGGGLRVRITFVSCGSAGSFNVPECPTAGGGVDASGSGEFKATLEIWDGSRLVSRQSSNFDKKAKVHGEVGADAKLEFIEIEQTQEVFIVASGGIVIRGGVTRKVRVEMPAGAFDPASASVRFFGDSISGDSGASAFADTADAAIRGYRGAESGWSSFERKPHCAEPIFSPPSNTLKLSKGKTGQLSITAKAQGGGQATAARWTLLGAENAEFSPSSSQDAAPTVSYTVTNAPAKGFVKVTAKFTSTAGVGEGTWTQPIDELINTIAGTFMVRVNEQGSVFTMEGEATYEREGPGVGAVGVYPLSSGTATVTASGTNPEGFCEKWFGSHQLPLAGNWHALVLSTTQPGGVEPPYTYLIDVGIHQTLEFTQDECIDPIHDDKTREWPTHIEFATDEQISADGIEYSGSKFETPGDGITIEQSWSFKGTP